MFKFDPSKVEMATTTASNIQAPSTDQLLENINKFQQVYKKWKVAEAHLSSNLYKAAKETNWDGVSVKENSFLPDNFAMLLNSEGDLIAILQDGQLRQMREPLELTIKRENWIEPERKSDHEYGEYRFSRINPLSVTLDG